MKVLTRYFLGSVLLVVFCVSTNAQQYRVLISNDDGIESLLLEKLYQEIQSMSNVEAVISAPLNNQSGASHSTDLSGTTVEKIYKDDVLFGYAVNARPADAVRYGIRELGKDKPFDLVVSGINRGANVGDIAHMSGTVGAAMEALYNGVPAIAVSQERYGVDTEASAKFVAQLITKYQKEGAPEGVVISINIPAGELKGVAIRPMGDSYFQRQFEQGEEVDGKIKVEEKYSMGKSSDSKTDTYAYQQGYITITPLKFDWTAYELFDQMNSWGLEIIKK